MSGETNETPATEKEPESNPTPKTRAPRDLREKPGFVLRRTARGAWVDVDTGPSPLETAGDAETWIKKHGKDGETYRACQGYPAVFVRPREVVLAEEG